MTNYRSLNHSKWACQYHVVFIPKYRKKAIYGSLRRHLGGVLRELARQRGKRGGGRASAGRPRPHDGVGGEFVGIRHRSIFGSREPGVPRDVVAMA